MANIKNNWARKPLSDIADVVSGYAFKSSEFGDRGVPVIKIKNIRVGSVDLSEVDRVNEKYLAIPDRYHVRPGDVLISLTGSHISQPNSVVGRVARHSASYPHCLLNQRGGKVMIRDRNTCELSFLFYALSEPKTVRAIAMKAHGAANQANVSPMQVESIEIPLPSLPIQRRIASILSAYDDLIENNTRRIAILEEMARRIYEEWFVHFRFPGHEKVKMVDSELGKIPEGWHCGNLGSISEVIPGFAFKSADWAERGIQVIKIKNITYNNQIDIEDCDRVPEYLLTPKMKKFTINTSDCLIAMTGATAGKAGRVRTNKTMLLNQRVAKISARQPFLSFIWAKLSSKETQQKLYRLADGAAQPNMSGNQIESLSLIIPKQEIIESFNRIADPIFQQTDCLFLRNFNLRTTRDFLLPKLISGEIDVSKLPEPEEAAA